MHVLLIANIHLIKIIHMHFFLAVGGFEELQKVPLELARVFVDVLFRVFADELHLADVAFGHGVLFEAVLVSALFGADLTVPAQALEAFGFHFVR